MFTSLVEFAAGMGSGVGGGLLAGLFGIGGGLVLIPLLAFCLKLEQHQAQGITLAALLLPNGLPAVLHYRRRGVPIHWPLVGFLICGFMSGVWSGAKTALHIPSGPLRMIFFVMLLVLAARMYFQGSGHDQAESASPPPATRDVWLPGFLIGLVGGFASGLMGIGGAILMNPLLVWRFRMPQHQAQLACLAMMLPPIGLPGVLVYAQSHKGLPWMILAGLAVGFLAGSYGGARIATRVKGAQLRKGFAGLMALMAGLLLVRGL
ncbi:MAG TPA: sulfite exporter TauE/SafE family protein [Holophaga sp.]|nr:sulfite exporter TauE/SafE family protein [Holophaga sp.]